MQIIEYDRQAAVEYAHRWAYSRNPNFYDYSNIGGDCTNFASQCLLAGGAAMNYTPTYGWYYINGNEKSPSWAGVQYFYNFMTANQGIGPFGYETSYFRAQPGDVVQLSTNGGPYHHTPVIVDIRSRYGGLSSILVAAHSDDADYRPLSTYQIYRIRFIHIDGIRVEG